MENILQSIDKIEQEVQNELNIISGKVSNDEVIIQAVDNIAVSVSAGLAEIRVLLQNKRRCKNIEIVGANTFIRLQNTVSVFLRGVEINPRTRIAKGFCCIIWNKEHSLNVCFKNPLTNIAKNTSTMLSYLALLNQANEIKLKKLQVIIEDEYIQKLHERMPLLHAQDYKSESGESIDNDFVLRDIKAALDKNNIQVSFCKAATIENEMYKMFKTASKELIKNMK